MNDLKPFIRHFNLMGKSKNETFQFWLEYCNMVLLLLDFLAAERDSDWKIHLETFQEMIYYDRAFDHYKYFSWGLVYLCDMAELPTKHPALYESFVNGQHTVSRSKSNSSFNCVSTDMALEQSLNRDSKAKGFFNELLLFFPFSMTSSSFLYDFFFEGRPKSFHLLIFHEVYLNPVSNFALDLGQ